MEIRTIRGMLVAIAVEELWLVFPQARLTVSPDHDADGALVSYTFRFSTPHGNRWYATSLTVSVAKMELAMESPEAFARRAFRAVIAELMATMPTVTA